MAAAPSSSASTMRATRVRYRCLPCEVAWTAQADEPCWVCGDAGMSLRAAHALREDDYLHLDFE